MRIPLAAGFSGLPSGAAIDTWISDEGFLVGLEATGFPGGDMSIQVSDVDDPANKVDRPSDFKTEAGPRVGTGLCARPAWGRRPPTGGVGGRRWSPRPVQPTSVGHREGHALFVRFMG